MAKVLFSVIVLIFVQTVFANVCHKGGDILVCDECIRCGGSWCSQTSDEKCAFFTDDVFCNGEPEELTRFDPVFHNGEMLQPSYVERTLFVRNPDIITFTYKSLAARNVRVAVYNSTQSFDHIDLTTDSLECDGKQCKVSIEAKVQADFCTSIGTTKEYIYVNMKVDNITEEAIIRYHVPCACECSKKIVKRSKKCSEHGDFACGVCQCYDNWSGENCGVHECKKRRGDVQCNNPLKDGVECSGNGYCGLCESCICYDDREGSQYFDPENYCSDICMDTSGCGRCLTNGTLGRCPDDDSECIHPMTVMQFNETTAVETDDYNRKIWAKCNDTFLAAGNTKCRVEYLAMKNEDSHVNVMIVQSCHDHTQVGLTNTPGTVPVILGVLALIAVVAAVGGVMLWKHMSATPPMPFSSPDYQNIDAEDCVGENPLYKSPTTTFTNPQFGKI